MRSRVTSYGPVAYPGSRSRALFWGDDNASKRVVSHSVIPAPRTTFSATYNRSAEDPVLRGPHWMAPDCSDRGLVFAHGRTRSQATVSGLVRPSVTQNRPYALPSVVEESDRQTILTDAYQCLASDPNLVSTLLHLSHPPDLSTTAEPIVKAYETMLLNQSPNATTQFLPRQPNIENQKPTNEWAPFLLKQLAADGSNADSVIESLQLLRKIRPASRPTDSTADTTHETLLEPPPRQWKSPSLYKPPSLNIMHGGGYPPPELTSPQARIAPSSARITAQQSRPPPPEFHVDSVVVDPTSDLPPEALKQPRKQQLSPQRYPSMQTNPSEEGEGQLMRTPDDEDDDGRSSTPTLTPLQQQSIRKPHLPDSGAEEDDITVSSTTARRIPSNTREDQQDQHHLFPVNPMSRATISHVLRPRTQPLQTPNSFNQRALRLVARVVSKRPDPNSPADLLCDVPPELKISLNEIQVIGPPISKGTFGTVFRGIWRNRTVAVKWCHVDNPPTLEQLRNFERELNAYWAIRHPNVCTFHGACIESLETLALVTEYLPGGNVFDLFFDNAISVSSAKRLNMARQLVAAIEHLHDCRPVVIHRDIKTPNLVLDAELNVKLCDFGKTRFMVSPRLIPN